ncbi:MAG: hypothetical protein CBD16_02305 [Betaproteobacteria bacterium TMED156]|nr:MAG: hypothetical protein CBD16_02305 [Betaproteobacteria bacterium TMED156]
MRTFLKLFLLTSWFITGFLWLFLFGKILNKSTFDKSTKWFAKILLLICELRVSFDTKNFSKTLNNTLVVSNHVSWIDIFVIHSLGIPGIFIAKSEIKRWPLLGILVENARTIFIDRKKKSSIVDVIKKSRSLLSKGNVIVFFPEGTTSDGSNILPFHTSFFSLYLDSPNTELFPIVIRYKKNNQNSSPVAYFGEMSFIQSILNTIKANKIEVEVKKINIIYKKQSKSDQIKILEKKKLAEIIRSKMTKEL